MDILKTALTAIFSAAVIFIITKIMGHKQISQLDIFDYVTGITVGSIAAEMATELENPIRPLVAMIIYGGVSLFFSVISNKCFKVRKYLNGTPSIILNGGKFYRENMKKAKLDLNEFLVLCRQEGYFDLSAIQTAVYEYNGKLNILPFSNRRPATPQDMNIEPPKDEISTEIIMDGLILEKNLQKLGYDLNWLEKQLKSQGYKSTNEVFLAQCDENGNLSVYAK